MYFKSSKYNKTLFEYSSIIQETKEEEAKLLLEKLWSESSAFRSMIQGSPLYFFMMSYLTLDLVYYTPNILGSIFRISDDEIDQKLKESGMNYIFSLIHPADLKILTQDCYQLSEKVMEQVPIEHRDNIRYTNNYRIRRGDGTWGKLLNQFCVVSDKKEGKPLYAMGTTHDITEQKLDNKIIFKADFFDQLTGHKSVVKEFVPEDSKMFYLTAREKEILNLIVKGNNAKQIAEMLFISEFIVKAHRRSIFEKTGVHKVAELIALLSKDGFLM